MKKTFLSHGNCDAALVSRFGEALEQSEVPVFLDKWISNLAKWSGQQSIKQLMRL